MQTSKNDAHMGNDIRGVAIIRSKDPGFHPEDNGRRWELHSNDVFQLSLDLPSSAPAKAEI
jgi:hypothetical protein